MDVVLRKKVMPIISFSDFLYSHVDSTPRGPDVV